MSTAGGGRIDVARPILLDRYTVSYDVSCTREMRKYFSGRGMFITYDADISIVPNSLLLIPLLSSLAPIAWALGADVSAHSIDAEFLRALGEIREAFRRLHPGANWTGDVFGDEVVDTRTSYPGRERAVLFSGGVDSVTSVVIHKEEKPRLVTVWGADLGLAQQRRWEQVSAANWKFAKSRSLDISFIKTNFRTFFNSYRLKPTYVDHFPNWYSAFQQGLGLAGLCAPLSYLHDLGSIYVPSTHSADYAPPWGSHPEIDNHVRWASTKAVHDGYALSRQKKLKLLANYIRAEDAQLPLRVCWGKGENCSQCEKCSITMIGLALEGLDPNDHGFRFSSATLPHIRKQLEHGRFNMSDTLVWILTEIQNQPIPEAGTVKMEGLKEFQTWLKGVSIEGLRKKSQKSLRIAVKGFLEKRPEPIGRSLRKTLGHPFP
jgi:hypothetical protein